MGPLSKPTNEREIRAGSASVAVPNSATLKCLHWLKSPPGIGLVSSRCVLVFLALDLGVFHRNAHEVKFKEALLWTTVWFCLAMLFALLLKPLRGEKEAWSFSPVI